MTGVRVVPGLDAGAWRRLRPGSALHDPGWLSVMSSRLPGAVYTVTYGDRLGFCAVLVRDPDAYEAYNPYTVLWRDPPVFELTRGERRSAALRELPAGPEHTLPALVLVAPGYLGDPAGRLADDPGVVEEVLTEVHRWCAANGLVGLHVLYAASPVLTEVVGRLGGSSYPITTRSVMPVWWDDWDGYLRGLPVHRRGEVRREERRAREAGLEAVRLDVGEHFEDILAGRCALLRRYGQLADEAAERKRLAALAEAFGDRLIGYGATRGREVVASTVCVVTGRRMHTIYAGASETAGARFAHFLAAFHGPVRDCSRSTLDEIDYGIGHGDGKVWRGCRTQPLFGHALGVGADRRGLLDRACRLLAEG